MAGPLISVIGSMSSGHDACPPVPAITGTSLFDVNGKDVVLIGDHFQNHGCPDHPTHSGIVTTGSSLVDVDGIPVAIEGSQIGGGGCTSSHVVAKGEELISIEM